MKQLYFKVLGMLVLLLSNYLAFSQNQIQRSTNPFTMAMGAFPGRMIVGDFDKDGDVDILYQNGNTAGVGFGFFKNNGGGVYQDFPDATVGVGNPFAGFSFAGENMVVNSLFVFDYDGDGDMDILDRDAGADPATTMGIWRNENGTSFTKLPIPFTTPAAWNVFYGRMITGDFDKDGDKDILFQAGNTPGIGFGYIRNNGGGSFTTFDNANNAGNPFTTFDFTNQQMTALMVVDYDNDGDVDIIDRDISGGGSLGVWKNNSGVFQFDAGPFTTLDNSPFYSRIIFGDFDSDGDQDALFQKGNTISAGFGYASNNGNGVFTITANATAAAGPFFGFDFTNEQLSALFVFDYDNDGDVDIIDRDLAGGGQIGLWKQLGTPPVRTSTSPLDDATTVSPTANIILTFNETVTKGTGNIYLYNATTNSVVATLPVGDAAVTSTDNLSWTINFPGNFTPNITYAIHLDAGIFKDADNMATAAITNNTTFNFFVPPPVPPTITNLNGDAATFTEGAAPAKLDVGGNASASDNLPDFNGAVLTVSFTANAIAAQDILGIENQGVAAGQIGVSGANVTFGGVTFATFTGGTSPANLVVTMNSNASYAAVTALLRALTYSNNSNNANANVRNISISITDAETAVATANVTASITRVNNPPVLTTPVNITVKEDENKLLTGISFADPDGIGTPARITFTTTTGSFIANALAGVTITGNNTTTLILDGTATILNTYLSGPSNVAFAFAPNQSSNVLVNVLVSDLGNTGGTAQTDNKDIQILGTAVNDMPGITAPASINITEDVLGNLSGFSFTDIDAGTSPVDVTLSVPSGSGTITTAAMAGITITNVSVNEVKLTGTLTDINTYISANNAGFTTALNNTANVILTVKINDGGFTGDDPGTSGTPTTEEFSTDITLIVAAVNDAPTITSPANYAATEDLPANINGVAFLDVDAGTSNLTQAVFNVSLGTLSATSGGGVTVIGSGSTSVTLQGTRADINAFITANSLTYNVASSQTTDATISISYNDAGDVGTGGALTANAGPIPINVTFVNDAPAITAPATINVQEDVLSSLSGYSFSDVDAAAATVDVTLSVPSGSGTITAVAGSGVTVTTVSANELMLSGSITDINSFIAASNVNFTTALNNTANVILTIKINDRGNTGTDPGNSGTPTSEEASTTVTLTVAAVNDAPTITAPSAYAVTEDILATIGGISFADVDGGTSITTQATLTVSLGTLNATSGGGVTVAGGGTGTLTLTGSRININAFIAANNIQYNLGATQTTDATLNISYNDAGDVGTGGALTANAGPIPLNVTYVNDRPVVTAPASITVQEDVLSTLAGYSFTDIDAASGMVDVTLSVPSGSGTLAAASGSGVTVTTVSPNELMLTGTVTDINSYISASNVGFTTALNNVSNIALTITINDRGNTGTDPGTSGTATSEEATAIVTIMVTAVNDAPTITAPASYAVTEDAPATINGVIFNDVDDGTSATTQAIFTVSLGTLSATSGGGVTVTGGGTAAVTLQGTRANINAFIAAGNLQYSNALTQTTNATLNISFNDAGDTGTGGALTANAGPIPLNVSYINDAPVITAPVSINVQEDLSSALAGYSFSDIDAGTAAVDVTLAVGSGTLSAAAMAGITITTVSPGTVMISGSITDINSYISANNIAFTTALNSVANVTLSITVNDRGNTGTDPGTSGNSTSEEATATVTLLVTAINDAPDINGQLDQSTFMNITKVFNTAGSNLISISDVDAGTALVSMRLEASAGLLSLSGTTGLTFTTGDGTADAILEFTGTIANINAALDGLSYVPPLDILGDISIMLKADDLGNSPGAPLSVTKELVLHVLPSTPIILSVSSGTPDGSYKVGDVLQLTVTFDQVVDVTGTPVLTLETGATDRSAMYVSGSGTRVLTFSYTVQSGDQSADLDYTSVNALAVSSGNIRNGSLLDGTLALPATGSANSLAGNKNLVIDGIAPFITSVNVPVNKTYVAGQPLNFSLNFSEIVTLNTAGGTPDITVQLESGNVQATYISGSGSNVLLYRYVVATGNLDNNGIVLGSHALNGATIKDATGNDALLTLNNVPATTGILVDAAAPVVTSVTVPANKIWKAGEVLNFTVNFSEPVIRTGATDPYIVLTIGASQVQALYKNGAGANAYLFSYTVAAGDLDRNGIAVGPSTSINLNGVTLKDAAGNDANLLLNNIGSLLDVWVDAVAPIVTAAQVFSVPENSAAGTAVGMVLGTDPGSTGTLQQWTITSNVNPDGDANPAFAINAATGAITVNDAGDLNFEATASLTISVSVSDGVNTSAVQTVVINLTNVPEPPLDIALSNNTILENNALAAQIGLLSATSSETGTTFTYTLVAGGADNTSFSIAGNSLRAVGAFDAETKTTYNIRIRATTQAGEFLEKPFVVTVTDVNETPTLNAITDRPYCATTAEVVIPLTGITPGPETAQTTTVSVSSNNAGLFTQLTADNTAIRLRFAAGANGNVTVTVTVKDNGGTANNGTDQIARSFNIAVTSIAAPVITSNKGTKISKGDFAALTATGGVNYAWDNSPGIISGQNSNVLNIRPQQNVTYRVTASNAAGCSASAQLAIEVIDDYKVNSANIMTPNGDGINDRFIIKNIDSYPGNELKIFDRSGRLIYTKRGYQNEWDGKVNGKALEEGTYYFMLDFGPGLPKVKGFITIIRDK